MATIIVRIVAVLALYTAALAADPTTTGAGKIVGVVKSGGAPIPGVTVIAANSLTGKKIATSTDLDGSFSLPITGRGRYVVRAEIAAFAAMTKELVFTAESLQSVQRADFELILQSRSNAEAEQQTRQQQQVAGALARRGFQSLELSTGQSGLSADSAQMPQAGNGNGSEASNPSFGASATNGVNTDASTESLSISGSMGRTQTFNMDEDRLQERAQEMRGQGGFRGPSGPGGGGPGEGGPMGGGPMILGGMGGGRNRFDVNRPHGTIFYNFGGSVFDARPYSLSGETNAQPDYTQSRFGAFLGGPLKWPGSKANNTKTFYFLGYFGTRAANPFDTFTTVPTLAERSGDFSQTFLHSGPNAGQLVQIVDSLTGLPFPGNKIPSNRINSAAAGLLSLFPLPNQPGDTQNYHRVTSTENNSENINFRLMHNLGGSSSSSPERGRGMFGGRNSINVGFNYRNNQSGIANSAPLLGGETDSHGMNFNLAYIRGWKAITNRLSFNLNLNHIETNNHFAGTQDVTGLLGINGVSTDPFDFGPPVLQFTNYSGLRDVLPLLRDDLTWQFNEGFSWTHGKHTVRAGGDFRRIHLDLRSNTNPRGTFLFTGVATADVAGGTPVSGTGFDLADFLLGFPQQTSAQFGSNTYQFRANSWDLYVQDDWRLLSNLTLNLGLRYEYVSPYSEEQNRLVNLDAAPDFSAVATVQPGQVGPFTGTFPLTLVDPDRNNFAPRIGIAWKPTKKMVVRTGYGINYDTGAYAGFVQQLAFQPPFSFTQTNISSVANPLTLQNGFPVTLDTVSNNFGVDRNYRLGYVQTWNLDLQQELIPNLIVNVGYTGSKGTRLDTERAPNRGPEGLLIPGVQPFLWQSSQSASILHSGIVRVRKRMQHGINVGGTYIYSHSIDNASTIGGGAVVVAQNDLDLAAERGNSSFDQRHRLSGDFVYELPFGLNKRWLSSSSTISRILGDWTWSGSFIVASGVPFTARVLGDFADVNRGTNGTLRADVTGQPITVPSSTVQQFFNTGAFVVPPPGQFGNAGRNTIYGPGTINFNMSFGKSFVLKDTRSLELRAQMTNVFNHPNFTSIDTVVNSPTFGQVIAVGPMRTMQMVMQFRF